MNTDFIEFLARSGAVKFGEFTLKSGRQSPYFVNTGLLSNGGLTYELGKYYARTIKDNFGENFEAIYGPAYKGIPLAVAASIALYKDYSINKKWVFDRKEKKIHGDSGGFVGAEMDIGARVILVDDVMTTGETKYEAIEKIEKGLKAQVAGLVIAVDRQEIGRRRSAVTEFSEEAGIPVYSVTAIADVFTHLKNRDVGGKVYVDDQTYEAFVEYRKKYGI